jgi:hypothetical protein
LKNETEKVVQRLCNFARPLNDFFCFLSHVHLRPFSFILNPKAELMDETAQKRGKKKYVIFLVLGKLFKRWIP